MEIDAEIVRLRSEVRLKVIAFNKLQNEKDNLNEQLRAAYDQIAKLREDIDIRDKFFAEYREKKEKEYTELLRIKTDREVINLFVYLYMS
jgi:predicted  nucleic acid-binding Zn-ribbon protein